MIDIPVTINAKPSQTQAPSALTASPAIHNQSTETTTAKSQIAQSLPAIKRLVPVATQAEDGLIKRIPAAIKTRYGLLYFYHQQIAGYDGDLQGVELWRALVTIDDNLATKVVYRERYLAPDLPQGIIKHPMLGRTSDNRIILMYETRLNTSDAYTRFQRFSSDEGVTWTEPVPVKPIGTNPAVLSALGTSGTILVADQHRLIVPMYTYGGTYYVIYSDDNGMTWRYSNWLDPTAIQGYEPAISLGAAGELIMNIRPKIPGQRLFAKSTDNGVTWQPMTVTPSLPSATTQGSLARVMLEDKTVAPTPPSTLQATLMVSHAADASEARTKFRLYLSQDNGQSYPVYYQPFADNWYGGYSQIIQWLDPIYLIMVEYSDQFTRVNTNENAGMLMLSSQEILSHLQPTAP